MGRKVLIVSYYFNLRDTDRAYTVYQYFKQAGFEVKILCGNYDHNSKKSVTYNLPEIVEVPVKPYGRNISVQRIRSYLKFARDARKAVEKLDFDIGYIVGPPNSTGYKLLPVIKKKHALFVTDVYDLYPETIPINGAFKDVLKYCGLWYWSYLRNAAIRKADIFIGSCQYYFTRLGLQESKKNHMIPLCKGEAMLEEVELLPVEQLNILYLGALTGNYDFEGLIRIMASMQNRGRKVHLDIIGDGQRKEWLLAALEKEGIPFTFHGRTYDDGKKQKIMEHCHFGFNGFKKEAAIALSYKSMEYMANGLALINSCKEDTWDLVENENIGVNYSEDTLETCCKRLCTAKAADVYAMKCAALKAYRERYCFSKYAEKMNHIFLELAN